MRRRTTAIVLLALGLLVGACERKVDEGKAAPTPEPTPEPTVSESGDSGDSSESGGPLSGEAAHTIPFADRTSMGYLLLLPAGPEPKVPTRATLRGLVEQAFPDRRRDGEIDLLLTLIDTEPHATDFGTLELPNFDDVADEESGADKRETIEVDPTEAVAKRERARSFDLLGLHIELVRLGLGEDTTIPASALADPVLTRDLSPAERDARVVDALREVGLDPQTRASIWGYIRELRANEEITIFMTTHYMDEAEFCDRIAIMDHGEIVAIDTPAALKDSVGHDTVRIQTEDDDRAIARLAERFGIEAVISEGAVTFGVEAGEAFVPRLFADLEVRIRSVNVNRPTLDDVFMKYTGASIRDVEQFDTKAQNRVVMQVLGGRR